MFGLTWFTWMNVIIITTTFMDFQKVVKTETFDDEDHLDDQRSSPNVDDDEDDDDEESNIDESFKLLLASFKEEIDATFSEAGSFS